MANQNAKDDILPAGDPPAEGAGDPQNKSYPTFHVLKVDEIDPELEKRLVRKLNWYLLPLLFTLYMFAFLDRTNIGNAHLAGMDADLKLDDSQFQVCQGDSSKTL